MVRMRMMIRIFFISDQTWNNCMMNTVLFLQKNCQTMMFPWCSSHSPRPRIHHGMRQIQVIIEVVQISFYSKNLKDQCRWAKNTEWEKNLHGKLFRAYMYIVDKSTCLIITWSHYKWFQDWEDGRVKHRGEDYESIKTAIGKRMLQQCIKLYPKMEGKVCLRLIKVLKKIK